MGRSDPSEEAEEEEEEDRAVWTACVSVLRESVSQALFSKVDYERSSHQMHLLHTAPLLRGDGRVAVMQWVAELHPSHPPVPQETRVEGADSAGRVVVWRSCHFVTVSGEKGGKTAAQSLQSLCLMRAIAPPDPAGQCSSSVLELEYTRGMMLGLAWVSASPTPRRAAVVDMGTGATYSFLQGVPLLQEVVGVEREPAVLSAASQYFGNVVEEAAEAGEWARQQQKASYAVLLLDAFGNDTPGAGLEELDRLLPLLAPTGALAVNIVTRLQDTSAWREALVSRCPVVFAFSPGPRQTVLIASPSPDVIASLDHLSRVSRALESSLDLRIDLSSLLPHTSMLAPAA